MNDEFQAKILALAGGVGGAKLAFGLAQTLTPDELQIVVNTGDDFWHLGLAISPDIDTVIYTLAGIANRESGWGRADETWNVMRGLETLGAPTWFKLGDFDLATHIWRTERLLQAASLTQVTNELAQRLGVRHRVAPMSNHAVETKVGTDEGLLPFQEYFVARQCRPRLQSLIFEGAAEADLSPALLRALHSPALQTIVLCPSNPFVSIAPILAMPVIAETLRQRRVPLVAVSPIIGGKAVKGPAGKMMAEMGMEISPLGIARHYGTLLDGLVIDNADEGLRASIEATGCKVHVCPALMHNDHDRIALARATLDFAATLRPRTI